MTAPEIAGLDNFDLSAMVSDLLASYPSKYPAKSKPDRIDTKLDKRKHFRHPVHWRAAIVNKVGDSHDVYHGQTHSVSIAGISVLLDHNIYFLSEVVVLLAIAPIHHGQKETIVEIQCRTIYTVLDSVHGKFRLGMKVIGYKGDGKQVLSNILSKRHMPKPEDNPYVTGYKPDYRKL
jgi:hypothetical protein